MLFVINNVEREEAVLRQRRSLRSETMKKFFVDLVDQHLARHSALINKTFYPERYQYHLNRFEKLSNYALPPRDEIIVWDEPADPEVIQSITNCTETQAILDEYEYLYKPTISSNKNIFWSAGLEDISEPSEESQLPTMDLPDHTVPVFSSHRR
jgi:hypothetical protein